MTDSNFSGQQRTKPVVLPLKRFGRLLFVLLGLAYAAWELRHFVRELRSLINRR